MARTFTKEKIFVGIGSLFIALGIFLNEWIVTALLSPDGSLEVSTKSAIWFFDILMILLGLLAIGYGKGILFSSHAVIKSTLIIFSTIIALISAELLLRIFGYEPWRIEQVNINVEPGGKFFAKHPTLGYTHLPGKYNVILPKSYSLMVTRFYSPLIDTESLPPSYSFGVTHLSNTLRVTRPLETYNLSDSRDEILVFGCSVTHGWSLNDDETYPWLLQESLPCYKIVNFGVTGYGTLHSLIQFQEALLKRKKPKAVIIAYGFFHDRRNTFLRLRRKGLVPLNKLGPLVQPYARVNKRGELMWSMATAQFHEFPLMRYSALIHLIEKAYNRIEERFYHSHEVSKAIIKRFSELCKKNGINLIIAGIDSNPITYDMLEYTRGEGILTTDISVDMNLPDNLNLPYDNHPSALANKKYAQKLKAFLLATVANTRTQED